jgi:Flp pilus assembly protein TadD
LGSAYERAGELAQAAAEYRVAISLNPRRPRNRYNLGAILLRLGSLDESKNIFEGTIADKIDNIDVHVGLYRIAYARRDAQGMQREVEWAAGKPDEFQMLWEQGEIALQEGRDKRGP